MTPDTRWKSALYGGAQSALLVAFGAAHLWSGGPWVLSRGDRMSLAGAIVCGIGIALILTAVVTLRRVIQIKPEPRADGELVTRGVYRWFRHPVYTGMLIAIVGLFLRKPTAIAAISALVVIVFLVFKVRFEERLLLDRYPGYAEYRKRTCGLLPGL